LLAALSVGTEIVTLRRIARRMNLGSELDTALAALRRGDIALAATRLNGLDDALAARLGAAALRARCSILAMSEALTQHPGYFEAGVAGGGFPETTRFAVLSRRCRCWWSPPGVSQSGFGGCAPRSC